MPGSSLCEEQSAGVGKCCAAQRNATQRNTGASAANSKFAQQRQRVGGGEKEMLSRAAWLGRAPVVARPVRRPLNVAAQHLARAACSNVAAGGARSLASAAPSAPPAFLSSLGASGGGVSHSTTEAVPSAEQPKLGGPSAKEVVNALALARPRFVAELRERAAREQPCQ